MCQRAARAIVCICLAVPLCSSRCATVDTIGELALEYVALALALDRHDPDFVDATAGRPQRAFVDATPLDETLSLDEIVTRAARARERARSVDGDARRAIFLAAQLVAVERRARWRRGEAIAIRDEAAALGLHLVRFNAELVTAIRSQLDRVIEGTEPLATRVALARQRAAVPRSRLDAALRSAIDECRARTERHLDVPESALDVRYVIDRPWLAYVVYEGGGRGTIEVRRDASLSKEDLWELACHETYPGHHFQNLVWDKELVQKRKWVEFSVTPLFTPHGVMAERAASAAASLAMPEAERDPVRQLLDALGPQALAVAVAYLDGEIERETALRRLADDLVMPQPEQFLDFVARYRAYAGAYVSSNPPVLSWEEYRDLLVSPDKLVHGAAR
jgi:hypothetical protein